MQTVVSVARARRAHDIEAWIEFTTNPGEAATWTTDGLETPEDFAEELRVRATRPGPLFFRVVASFGDESNAAMSLP